MQPKHDESWWLLERHRQWWAVRELHYKPCGDLMFPTKEEAVLEARRKNRLRLMEKQSAIFAAEEEYHQALINFQNGRVHGWSFEGGDHWIDSDDPIDVKEIPA